MILSIVVKESSGNRGCDLAIMSLVRDLKRFPALPEELRGESFQALISFHPFGTGSPPKRIELVQQTPPQEGELMPPASFNLALDSYLARQYDLAITGFENYLRQFPSTSLASDVQYLLAESYRYRSHYNKALEAYQRLLNSYPASDKVPVALYKAGTVYAELGEVSKAQGVFQRVVAEYPQSPEAQKAAVFLDYLLPRP
jgi:tol-pal system protein YbgF